LFSPREAEAERHSLAPGHRRPHQKPNVLKTARFLRDHYDINSYRRAIQRACVEGGIASWHPHQLRHTAATEVRKRYGLEAAALILGHARCDVTQVYAEINQARALQIAAEVG
jgi:integrase